MEQSLDIQMKPLALLKFAFPTMIANLFMSIYMTVDGIFVSNCVNTNALSAVDRNRRKCNCVPSVGRRT